MSTVLSCAKPYLSFSFFTQRKLKKKVKIRKKSLTELRVLDILFDDLAIFDNKIAGFSTERVASLAKGFRISEKFSRGNFYRFLVQRNFF